MTTMLHQQCGCFLLTLEVMLFIIHCWLEYFLGNRYILLKYYNGIIYNVMFFEIHIVF